MSELFLVRHAQASFGSDNYDQLSELGHRQSRWLGEYFRSRDIRFDAVITGEMVRHEETADGIIDGLGSNSFDRESLQNWNEFDFHRLTAIYLQQHPEYRLPDDPGFRDYYRLLKQALLAWADDLLDCASNGMETWPEFEQRVQVMLDQLQCGPSDRKVLIVSSGGAISMALRHILAAPAATMVQHNLQTRNTGLSHCFFSKTSISLMAFNHVPHLDDEGRRQYITYT